MSLGGNGLLVAPGGSDFAPGVQGWAGFAGLGSRWLCSLAEATIVANLGLEGARRLGFVLLVSLMQPKAEQSRSENGPEEQEDCE
jgi:hypothetical protein